MKYKQGFDNKQVMNNSSLRNCFRKDSITRRGRRGRIKSRKSSVWEWVIQKQVQRSIQAKSLRAGADHTPLDAQIICQWLSSIWLYPTFLCALEPHVKQRHIGPNGMQDEVGAEGKE